MPIVFKANYQMLADKFKTANRTNKSTQTIFTNDNQIQAANFKSPTNEDPNFQNDKFQTIEQTSNDLNEVFKHQIDLQNFKYQIQILTTHLLISITVQLQTYYPYQTNSS